MRRPLAVVLAAFLLASILAPAPGARADAEKDALQDRLRAVEDELALLRQQFQSKTESNTSEADAGAVVSADGSGFQIRSSDKKSYRLRLRGYWQTDGRFFAEGGRETGTETFAMRRVRPILEGTVFDYVDFRFMPDFGQGQVRLLDAYVNLRLWNQAELQAGQFKAPFGLERLKSSTQLTFIERGLPDNLVPNRDIGVMLHGSFREGMFDYQAGLMNGVQDGSVTGGSDTNDDKEAVLRVFAHPFQELAFEPLQGLGVGFAASIGEENDTPASYKTAGRATFFKYGGSVAENGTRLRFSPQAYWYWGPFGLLAEWVRSKPQLQLPDGTDIEPDIDAWQVQLSYVLTGEKASYRGVTPASSFRGQDGGMGAWEVAVRFGGLRVDDDVFDEGFANPATAAEKAYAWALGANWYMNPFVKLSLDYEQTRFDGGAANGDRPTEGTILSRIQVAF